MYSTRMKTSGIALVVLCASSALTLAAPQTVRAQSHVQTVETAQEISGICAEQYRVEFVLPRFGAYLAIADQQGPAPHTAYRTPPAELVHAELQVPAALLRTLLMEEGIRRTIALHVPAALLATLSTEGWVQMPQRSPALCGPFFSLY
jgi:hypothetical protein